MSDERTATAICWSRAGPSDGDGLLSGDELKAAAERYRDRLRSRVLGPQRGIGTFFDRAIHETLGLLETLPEGVPWERAVPEAPLPEAQGRFLEKAFETFRVFLTRQERGRFVDYAERRRRASSDIPPLVQKMSQGAGTCLAWNGLPLFKSVFDFALYPMLLAEVRPGTLFEIGSGTGASAAWLADLTWMQGFDCRIYSLDLVPPALEIDRVRFIEGDCNDVAAAFGPRLLASAPRPWVVIEDAHVNVRGVLEHFDAAMREGDYLVIEDSKDKRQDIEVFCERACGRYRVDTLFTDFFGKNCTTAHDSILRCMEDERDPRPSGPQGARGGMEADA